MEIEEYIKSQIVFWSKKLHLSLFTITCKLDNTVSYLSCHINHPYLNVCINYSNKVVEEYKEGKDISEHILHELCHIITEPMYLLCFERFISQNEIEDTRERCTDHISTIVFRIVEGLNGD